MPYSGVYVFGDSLVDAGNALKLAQWYGDLTFSDLPDGAPSSEEGYFDGRFADGYTFADLLANKAIGQVTDPVFPFGYVDPWIGIEIAPWTPEPNGNNLNFAYGGAQVRGADEAVLDLDGQTDAFKDAVDGDAPPGALYIVTMGGNDVRNLATVTGNPGDTAGGFAALDRVANQMIDELGQLISSGARSFLITGIADVGLIPDYDIDQSGTLDATEQARADAATLFSQYLDLLIRTEVVPALEARGATVTYVPMMDGLNAVLPTLEALHDLAPGTLTTDLLAHHQLVFFDDIHPTAQVHALFGSYAQALLAGTEWIETLPLTGADVDYSLTASIAAVGEVDQLIVAMVAGTEYRFDMLGISSLGVAGTLADPAVRLLAPSGSLAAANADDGAGFDAVLTFNPAAGGNYTLQLSATGEVTGAYTLQATVVGGAAMQSGNSYTVSNAATLVLEGVGGVGQDAVRTSVSYALAAGSEIEVLATATAKGKTAINLTGNEFDQQLTGNAGNNRLDGKAGADTLTGGAGKDVFVLGSHALAGPGNIDTIADYGNGDVVDLTQVLNLAAGTNAVAAGFVRVTTGGLVQVDLDGGGNQWVTLANINNGGAVAVRYVSGGAPTTVSVSRVAAGTAMTGAVAAAGLMAIPAETEVSGGAPDAQPSASNAALPAMIAAIASPEEGLSHPAWPGETRDVAVQDFTASPGHLAMAVSLDLDTSPLQAPAALLAASEPAAAAALPVVTGALAMPGVEALPAAAPADEVARILADALHGGGGSGPSIDALLDAAAGADQPALAVAGDPGGGGALPMIQLALLDMMAVHADAPVTV